jgi:hypothetical protein
MKAIQYIDTISADLYPSYLNSIAEKLPSQALEFAGNINHYDFYGDFCTHDLEFRLFTTDRIDGGIMHKLDLQANKFKHLFDLEILYFEVHKLFLLKKNLDKDNYGDLIIDEVSWDFNLRLVVHELQFINMSLTIYCQDLKATWVESEYLKSLEG